MTGSGFQKVLSGSEVATKPPDEPWLSAREGVNYYSNERILGMKKKWINAALLFFAGSLCLQTSVFADVADRVVAVVGRDIILKSDIDSRVLMARMQYPALAKDNKLNRSILDGLIDQKLILAKAKIDSVTVDEPALESTTTDRFRQLSARFASKEDMESQLGKPAPAIREELRQDLRNQQLIETLRRKKSAGQTVSYDEVMAFYKANSQNIPEIPEGVAVSQIIKYPPISAESRSRALVMIKQVQKELQGGADFAELARKYSQDPGSAKSGGDLGYIQKGQLVPSFEDAAYALKEGAVSDVVETRYGFHLIQLLNKEPNELHARHILVGFDKSTSDYSGIIQQLKALRSDVLSGKATFAEMAKQHSDDPVSAKLGGSIGTSKQQHFTLINLRPQLQQVISTLKTPGQISEPVKIDPPQGESFYAIFQLNDRVAAHSLDPVKDYSMLEEQALDNKNRKSFAAWIEKLRKEIYVRISDI